MDECPSPKCHEKMQLQSEEVKTELKKRLVNLEKMITKQLALKLTKKTMWAVLVVIGIPLFVTGVKVWSQQEHSDLRFAEKKELVEIDKRQTELRTVVKGLTDNIQEIKKGQEESQKDIKEILRHLRNCKPTK